MIVSFDAFADNIQLIADYCQVFVDDPLLEWVWDNKRSNISRKGADLSKSDEPTEKAYFNKKIESVRRKLMRQNPRIILQRMLLDSPHKHIDKLK